MSSSNRRDFLKTAAAIAGAATVSASGTSRAGDAQSKVRMALIGCGGRGTGVAGEFAAIEGVELAYACDPDSRRAAETAAKLGSKAEPVADLRKVLDDKSIDAVIVATPDHWHSPASILACDAEKHVYVEKPCSHNVREGRLLVEAAKRNNRLVQHGTQSRSIPLLKHAIALLRDGAIGDVLTAKAWNVQQRGPIGRAQPSDPPAEVDYDMWVGPAPLVPFQSNRFHYSWHWWYDFGTGDMGNDGVHELDIARWGLGVDAHPTRIAATGGKLAFDDDQEFPDTQYVSFDYDRDVPQRRQLVFEMRLWSRYGIDGIDNGNAFYGTRGWMLVSKRGILKVFDARGNEIAVPGDPPEGPSHFQNFVSAIRDGEKLAAPIEEGHLSASLCHLGNIATRLGRSLRFDHQSETILGDEEAAGMLARRYRDGGHWAIPAEV
jgi:predicted dehydrogenase